MEKKSTVLIVDDIPRNIQLVAQHLKPLGFKLLFATSGMKALTLLRENPVDLILLDVMMPELNGFETCRKIKEEPELKRIPVIFLTARNEVTDIVRGFDSGGADYIIKPFHGQELIERVKTHLDLKHHRDQQQRRQAQLKELLHILSHDLRNSFSGITMTMDLAQLEKKSLDVYDFRLREMADNGLNIIDLVRTMLALEEKPLQLNPVDLLFCLEQSLSIIEPALEKKRITVKREYSGEISVMAEPTSLVNSVLNNLLTNAVKFSFEEGILEIAAGREGHHVFLRIRDHGIGIPPEQLVSLFDIHKAVSRPGTGGERGTGFGLPLVGKFMHAYDGEIRIVSVPAGNGGGDQGTTITLLFPEVPSL